MNDAKGKPQKEPTMEEILASIRRIISDEAPAQPVEEEVLVLTEDVKKPAVAAPAAAPAPAMAPAAPPPAPPQPAAPTPSPASMMSQAAQTMTDIPGTPVTPASPPPPSMPPAQPSAMPMPQAAPVQPPVPQVAASQPAPIQPQPNIRVTATPAPVDNSGLVSPKVQAGSLAALAQLQQAARPQAQRGQMQSSDGLLVESLVRSAIEPMLKNWLDQNLQTIVENMVRREIERLAKKAELG